MSEPEGLPKISEVRKDHEDKRLSRLVNPYEAGGWTKVVGDVTGEILKNPGWLVNGQYMPLYSIGFIQKLLEKIRSSRLERLDDLGRYQLDTPAQNAFVVRFMEIFSQKYNFPYVWRGGSLDNLDRGVTGTFTFFVSEAKSKVMESYDGPRKRPCLIGLPVKAIVSNFKENKGRQNILAEHGLDGIFRISFDISLPDIPDGTMIYLPD